MKLIDKEEVINIIVNQNLTYPENAVQWMVSKIKELPVFEFDVKAKEEK